MRNAKEILKKYGILITAEEDVWQRLAKHRHKCGWKLIKKDPGRSCFFKADTSLSLIHI